MPYTHEVDDEQSNSASTETTTRWALRCYECHQTYSDDEYMDVCPECATNNVATWMYSPNES